MADRPRRVRGGIRLISKQYPLSLSWIGQGWLDAVSRHAREQELKEGFDYARAGQARGLVIEPGRITALVQGRAVRAYRVSFQVRTFDDEQWGRAIQAIADQALIGGRLLSGEASEDLADVFTGVGVSLLPTGDNDLVAACAAPNERPWCKHACCVALLVAEMLEKHPLHIMTLRGLPPAELIERIRDKRSAATAAAAVQGAEPGTATAETSPPLEAVIDDFWDAGPGLAELETPIRKPDVSHALLRRLGPSPFTENRFPLVGLLATCYDLVGDSALKPTEEEAPADGANPAAPS